MMNICTKVNKNIDMNIVENMEKKYGITMLDDIKEFYKNNAGGYPVKSIITIDENDYEIRVFLSLDRNDEYFCAEKPIDYFLDATKGRIIPIGVDSGDNYYCVNNETGKVYYWNHSFDEYYCISESLNEFNNYFI